MCQILPVKFRAIDHEGTQGTSPRVTVQRAFDLLAILRCSLIHFQIRTRSKAELVEGKVYVTHYDDYGLEEEVHINGLFLMHKTRASTKEEEASKSQL
ncbi:hypothetical protein VNO77_41900 [Canavalia gladiata]|uniref:Uncharacterized protein n=1 Tax=Canavalia gladiata TaxID=3824 RepID=A0AAN9PSW6_CANGL